MEKLKKKKKDQEYDYYKGTSHGYLLGEEGFSDFEESQLETVRVLAIFYLLI